MSRVYSLISQDFCPICAHNFAIVNFERKILTSALNLALNCIYHNQSSPAKMKFFLMFLTLVLPIFVLSDEKPRMEVSSEGRKLRGSDDYSQKSLPVDTLKKVAASFPGQPLTRSNSTLDEKASRTNPNHSALHTAIIHYHLDAVGIYIKYFDFCIFNNVLQLHRLAPFQLSLTVF